MTVLPQEALFFDVTVREAIAYGRPGASEARDRGGGAAPRARTSSSSASPQGYDTRIGQRGRSLSGGQRQRLAIARALLRDAPVLVLDEPTTGLDNENATQILESIRRLMAGKTTIIVSHDLHLVRQATRIVVLDRGRVVEEGNHEALMACRRSVCPAVAGARAGRRGEQVGKSASRERDESREPELASAS